MFCPQVPMSAEMIKYLQHLQASRNPAAHFNLLHEQSAVPASTIPVSTVTPQNSQPVTGIFDSTPKGYTYSETKLDSSDTPESLRNLSYSLENSPPQVSPTSKSETLSNGTSSSISSSPEIELHNYKVMDHSNPLLLYPNTLISIADMLKNSTNTAPSSSRKRKRVSFADLESLAAPEPKRQKEESYKAPTSLLTFLNVCPIQYFPGTNIPNLMPMVSYCVQSVMTSLNGFDKYHEYKTPHFKTYLDHMLEAHLQYFSNSMAPVPMPVPATATPARKIQFK